MTRGFPGWWIERTPGMCCFSSATRPILHTCRRCSHGSRSNMSAFMKIVSLRSMKCGEAPHTRVTFLRHGIFEPVASLSGDIPVEPVAVFGGVILDRYWWGECDRLSPEAPVPIVRKQRATVRPGGAANTAANLVALGAAAAVAGVVGADAAAAELRDALSAGDVTAFLVEDPARPTTTKTRIMALHQQVV